MLNLDGLGRKILLIIDSQDSFTLVSNDVIGGDLAGQKISIDMALKMVACDSFVFQSSRFDKYALLDAMSSRARCKNTASDRRKGSYYRAICDYVKRLKRVCLVIYDADLVEPEGLLMLARVTGFAKRNKFLFSIIFIGNTTRIRRTSNLSGIEIDRFIPRSSSNQ
ncbi:MAG: hypothetical protein ACI8XV_001209 [Arenicella sp.]|jgi:hypothetical protein